MTAARTGRLSAVRALLAQGATVDATEARSQTALMWAAAEGHVEVVDALIQAGADFRKSIHSGFTPLFFAVREGRIEVTRRLLAAGVDVNGTMQIKKRRGKGPVKGTSPLLLAMENGHFELAAVLLAAGGNPNDARTGYTPLHALSWIRKPDKGDSDSSIPPPIGSGRLTSLQFAQKLVEAGAGVNARKKDKSGGRRKISTPGTTPFLCAAGTADTAFMKTLLALGADPKINNAQNRTALMMAAGIGEGPEGDGPGTKPEHFEAVQFLLDLGVEINAVDKNGETAMHATAYKSLPKVAQLLSDRGADIRIWAKKSKQGRTPLSIAQATAPATSSRRSKRSPRSRRSCAPRASHRPRRRRSAAIVTATDRLRSAWCPRIGKAHTRSECFYWSNSRLPSAAPTPTLKRAMSNEQVRMIAGSLLISGGSIGYAIANGTPGYEGRVMSFLVMLLGVPLLFPGLWGSLKSRVRALSSKDK